MALTLPLHSFWGAVVPLASLIGLGMAFVVSPLSTAVMAAVPDTRSGAASGVNNAVSRVAGLVAIASMGPLAAAIYRANGGMESFAATSADASHVMATSSGFAAILWVAAGMSALSACIAWVWIRPDDTAPGDTHARSHDPGPEGR